MNVSPQRRFVMLLGKAVAEGEVEIVRDLLARGADPNRLEEESTPIEWAMTLLSNSRPDVVRDVFACIELCLDAGADPNVMWDGPTTYGDCGTPLGEAVTQARPEFVRLLLSAGADPNVPPDQEIFPRVVAFWAHAGFYVSKAAVEEMRAVEAEFTSLGLVVCPQLRRLLDMYRERHPDREDDPRLQRLSDSLAALEVSVGLDPGVEANPIEADFSDSD